MNILAFDTASSLLNIALSTDRGFFEINHSIGLTHSEHLLPSVDYLLKTAGSTASELDLIICTRGPGSFTGLRIGMATAKGMAAAGASRWSPSLPSLYMQLTVSVLTRW